MKVVALAGTMDSKGIEYGYIQSLLESVGIGTLVVHSGVFEPLIVPDVSNAEVAAAAGYDIKEIASRKDRGYATQALSKGMEAIIPRLYEEGKFDGIISLGGTGGTSLATPAMRALPIGVPKLMVSTVASGDTSRFVGTSDIVMMPSIVDVAGLNSISRTIFRNAAAAIAGMVGYRGSFPAEAEESKPLIAATMFGVTTPCINAAKAYLEEKGYEVLVFHATGVGGRTMESLVHAGFIRGVLDITTTEWCDEIVGGVLAAGPHRSEAAALKGVPQVVSVGALDMVNFGAYDEVPKQFAGRKLYRHNPSTTLMRTSMEEIRLIGAKLAEKLNMASGNTVLMLPLKGVSMIDVEGQPFYGPQEDAVLFDILRSQVNRDAVEIVEMDCDINDERFALAAAQRLLNMINH